MLDTGVCMVGVCIQGVCMAGAVHSSWGMQGRGHVWHGTVHGRGGHAWQERRLLKRAVRILLECILVFNCLVMDPGFFKGGANPKTVEDRAMVWLKFHTIFLEME